MRTASCNPRPPRKRLPSSFAIELRQARDRYGWTQNQIAIEANIERWKISHAEVLLRPLTRAEQKSVHAALVRLAAGKARPVRVPRLKRSRRDDAALMPTAMNAGVPILEA